VNDWENNCLLFGHQLNIVFMLEFEWEIPFGSTT